MVKHFYYYYRTKKNRPVVTVCVIIDVGKKVVISRGVAICHPKDNFCKERGRKLAYSRAMAAAFCSNGNILPIKVRDELDDVLSLISVKDIWAGVFEYKGHTMPRMTEIEERLLKRVSKWREGSNPEVMIHQEDDGEID